MIQKWYRLEYSYIDAWGYSRSADLRFDTPEERNRKLLEVMTDENKKLTFYSKSDVFNCWIEKRKKGLTKPSPYGKITPSKSQER